MLKKLTQKEFNEYARNHMLSSFFQSSYWGTLKEHNGWKSHLLGFTRDGKLVAAALLLSKKIQFLNKNIFYSPRGFLINYEDKELLKEFTTEVVNYTKKEHGIFLKINPLIPFRERDVDGNIIDPLHNNKELIDYLIELGFEHNGFDENVPNLEPRFISVLDLENKTEEDLLKNMRATTRWSIKNSYKNSLKVIEAKKSDLNTFKKLMKHTSERRGFIDRPLSYYENMYESFSKTKDIKVLLVEFDANGQVRKYQEDIEEITKKLEQAHKSKKKKEGQIKEFESQIKSIEHKISEVKELKKQYGNKVIVAGGLYMLFGRQIIYLFGASLKPFMKYNSQYLLQWEMIKYAKENNYQNFNFYGIEPAFHHDHPMFGLFDFKRGFDAKPVELIGEFNYILNRRSYKTYNFMLKIYKTLRKVRSK